MSISYSAITNNGKVTLPSVDTWGTNMNILKDPPKSISTRRIDKVGQTSSITEMIDESENRAAECILPFARGVNPSVSVSYSNSSNNGGQLTGGFNSGEGRGFNYSTNASLPYKVGEAFRPPVLTQYDTLPLSRLPRIWTTAFSKPGFSDFSKKMYTCGTAKETKEVKDTLLKTSVKPTAVYNIKNTPTAAPFEVKYVIQPLRNKSYTTSLKSTDITSRDVINPTKNINYDKINTSAISNPQNIKYTNEFNFDTNKYIQDVNNSSAYTNNFSNIQISPLEDILDLSAIKTKDIHFTDYTTTLSGNNKNEYIHEDIQLKRVLPEYSTVTNFKGDNKNEYIHEDIQLDRVLPSHSAFSNIKQNQENIIQHEYMKPMERNVPSYNIQINSKSMGDNIVSSRDYRLNDKLQYGEYNIPGQVPTMNRIQEMIQPYDNEKSKLGKNISRQFEGRYN
jgi:hypothetical protein